MRVWSTRHHGSEGLDFIGNPHPTQWFSHTHFLMGTSTLRCGDASPWSYFISDSWAPPPYTAGMHPHGRISSWIWSSHWAPTPNLSCSAPLPHSFSFSFSCSHSYSTLGHHHPPFFFSSTHHFQGHLHPMLQGHTHNHHLFPLPYSWLVPTPINPGLKSHPTTQSSPSCSRTHIHHPSHQHQHLPPFTCTTFCAPLTPNEPTPIEPSCSWTQNHLDSIVSNPAISIPTTLLSRALPPQHTATTTLAPPSNGYPTMDYKPIPDLTPRTPPRSTLPRPPETQPIHPQLVMVIWDRTVDELAIWMPTESQMGDIQILFIFFNF